MCGEAELCHGIHVYLCILQPGSLDGHLELANRPGACKQYPDEQMVACCAYQLVYVVLLPVATGVKYM